MLLKENTKKIAGWIADLVFPVYCVTCGAEGSFLCDNCAQTIPKLENQLCIVCEKPAPFGKTHPDCISKNKLDGIISALPYRNPQVANLIETFKYKFIDNLAPKLSKLLVEEIKNQNLEGYFNSFTIIPVPLHKKRFNWRGFNQAELIANSLSKDLSAPMDANLVQRTKFTKPQVKLERSQRQENMKDAFVLAKPETNGKFLLVDDVVTTGSTLNEMTKLLKKSGATEVWAVTVAHG
jgi:ComF family protein